MTQDNASEGRNRLCVYNGGFLTGGRLRRILELAGWDVSVGVPGADDWVGLWGRTPTAWRGEKVAGWTEAPVLTVEDAFLRSVHPGRVGNEAPVGLCLDGTGVHFDGSTPSDLETLLATHPLDDTALLNRAREAIESIAYWRIGKYSATDTTIDPPAPGYVVVIDQTQGDAALCGADRADFVEMLAFAAEEHPGNQILIKTHPESASGARPGHFGSQDETDRIKIISDPISPHRLFEGAVAVYSHSSNLGFEAIFCEHKPRIFGQPFYAGWGLTLDQDAPARRERTLTRAQLFAAAMILYPVWYDPIRDRLCEIEDVIAHLAAATRAWREDRNGYVAVGMKRWKRPHLSRAFGREKRLRYARRFPSTQKATPVVWGAQEAPQGTLRMEDGLLRSTGLGAALTPPLSLVLDEPSLYFDPAQKGRLDRLCNESGSLPVGEIRRAERLISRIRRKGLTKYNIQGDLPDIATDKRKILVAGQVEDDASLKFGASGWRTNHDLLAKTRDLNPDAYLMWKPHPDVEAGLRDGAVDPDVVAKLADITLAGVGANQALSAADEVWTICSTLGFEAVLREISVTCLGMPFYAGRGLTTDLVNRPDHRTTDVSLPGLAHACLIGYPRYFDPRDGQPISVEQAAYLLESGLEFPPVNRVMAWLNSLTLPLRR